MRNLLKMLVMSTLCTQAMAFQEIKKNDVFEHFFGIDNSRDCKRNKSCKMLRKHLNRDSKSCLMNPEDVGIVENYVLESSGSSQNNIAGSIRYLGAVPGSYGYDTSFDVTGTLVIESRIRFSNLDEFSESDVNYLKEKLKRASDIWTDNNRFTDYPVRFSLLLETGRGAHITAKLQRPYTRGPYFSRWSLNWSTTTMAHEFGHILGLDDEYANNPFGGSLSGCHTSSIMCSSQGGRPQDYQYYVIFRRLLCN